MESQQPSFTILMLPWLAHGHLSPFLELAKRLTKRHIHVYLCSTPINLKPLKENGDDNHELFSITLIDIHLPSSPELPPEYHTTKNLPPHLMSTLKTAFDESKEAFRDIVKEIKPDLVVYDFIQPWAPTVCDEENIPGVVFISTSAAACAFMNHCLVNKPVEDYPFPGFNLHESRPEKILHFLYDTANGITNKDRFLQCVERSSSFVLKKTSYEIEGKYIDYYSELIQKEVVPVGPLLQEPAEKDEDSAIMEWLSQKDSSSVVFVSFGSEYFLSKEELEEVAYGLELSDVSFIWVVRFHGGGKMSLQEALPEGFLKRVEKKAMVMEGWAPQAKILKHSSIGGFVSHCGWSSVLESLMFGVPIIAMPMQLDQPFNARLVMEIGGGVEVPKENGRFCRVEIGRAIKEVIKEEKGKEVRKKVKELSEKMIERGDEEMDVAVGKLVQLVGRKLEQT